MTRVANQPPSARDQVAPRREHITQVVIAVGLLVVLLGAGVVGLPVRGPWGALGAGWFALALGVYGYVFFSVADFVRALREAAVGPARPFILPLIAWALFALCAASQGKLSPLPLFIAGAYLLAPVLPYVVSRPLPQRLTLRDVVALVIIWLPQELGLLPGLQVPTASGPGIELLQLLAIPNALWLLLAVRPLEDVGYSFLVGGRDLGIALLCVLGFAVTGLPLGLATGFLSFHATPHPAGEMAARAAQIFFFIALTEELFFRGIIQNLLVKSLAHHRHGVWWGLGLASIFFGLCNSNERDWRYVVLATIAGIFYGLAYLKTRKVVPAAFVHLALDWTWSTYF